MTGQGAPYGQVIGIRCVVRHDAIVDVAVEPRRRLPVERLLAGRPVQSVLPLLSGVFSVCRHAHELAASLTLAAAQERRPDESELRRCEFRRDLEIVREHGLNLLQSPACGHAAELARGLVAQVHALSGASGAVDPADTRWATLETILGRVFGGFWDMADPGLEQVLAWSKSEDAPAALLIRSVSRPGRAAFGACASSALPVLPADQLEAVLRCVDVAATAELPTWDGHPCESTSFSRQMHAPLMKEVVEAHGNGLLARTLARMVEVREIVDRWCRPSKPEGRVSPAGGRGMGVAQVDASRGRLIHRAELDGGNVLDYRILAPTEWNFHPRGLVRNALVGASGEAVELRGKVLDFLRCVDSCVHFDLSFDAEEAGDDTEAMPAGFPTGHES